MVKIYLRYALKSTFGVLTSSPSNVVLDSSGKTAITGALEHVIAWDLKKGTKVLTLSDQSEKKQPLVSKVLLSPDKLHLAAGYTNGIIRIWDLSTRKVVNSFSGHTSQVSALAFDQSGQLLVSGSHDTDLIIWDLVTDSGLFKLRGHKNAITDLKFLEKSGRFVVSSSKDFLLKVWNLDTQHCIQTIVGHRSEIWSFDINQKENRLVTVCDDQLRFYKIEHPQNEENSEKFKKRKENDEENKMEIENETLIDTSENRITYFGSIDRKSKERGSLVRYNLDGSVIGVQSAGKTIELLRVHEKEEIKERRKIRFAREKSRAKKMHQQALKEHEKLLNQLKSVSKNYTETVIPPEPVLQVPEKVHQPSDEVSHSQILRTSSKLQSFCWSPSSTKELVVTTSMNSIEHYKVQIKRREQSTENEESEEEENDVKEEKSESSLLSTIELPGHRSDVRAIALSSNNEMLVSASNGLVKVWNVRTLSVIRTIQTGYGLCVAYTPGDRHIVLGTKEGKLELYDLQSTRLLESIDAHTGAVWTLQMCPDGTKFISASADKRIKFWSFSLVKDKSSSINTLVDPQRLSIEHISTFEVQDDCLASKVSKDGKYLAVALLDSTVKIYELDTMKLFLTLYGHKLPVMSLDISDDGAVIVTGSADKNIRIWGMDFGDCHKSIFAHSDSVMGLAFVPQTHYLFSVGKDGLVKYWDADKFELILTLEGHQSEAWALAVASTGDFLISGSHDRSLRIWERTEEQLVPSDERETEMERQWELTMEAEDKYADEEKAESSKATRQTMETVKAGEKLIDALEIIETDENNLRAYHDDMRKARLLGEKQPELKVQKPPPSERMNGKNASDFLLQCIKSIRSSELDEALLLLPFSMVLKVITFIEKWIDQDLNVELCSRILFFLVRTHQTQISANKSSQTILHSIRDKIKAQITKQKDMIGFNQVALNYMKKHMEQESNIKFFQAREDAFLSHGAKRQKVVKKNYWE